MSITTKITFIFSYCIFLCMHKGCQLQTFKWYFHVIYLLQIYKWWSKKALWNFWPGKEGKKGMLRYITNLWVNNYFIAGVSQNLWCLLTCCEYLSEWSSWKSHGFSYVAKIFRESEFLFYILNFTVLSSSPRHIIVTLHNVTHLDFWHVNISSKCFLKNWMFIHLFPTTTHVISSLFLFRNEVMMLILLQFFHSLHLSLNRKRMKRKREKDQKRVSHWKNWLKEYQHVVFLS